MPTPLSMSMVVVGGDACLASEKDAWSASWVAVSSKVYQAPKGSLVLHGPQKGSPDILASDAAKSYGHIDVCLQRDGRAYASASWSRDPKIVPPYERRDCGAWSDKPTPEGLAMELAQQASLAKAAGWDVLVLIAHGWDGSFRGERLAERMRHLGVATTEFDVAKDGRMLWRLRLDARTQTYFSTGERAEGKLP